MSPRLPYQFVSVETAKTSPRGSYVSVIGIVVDGLPPCQSRGSSYVSTFTIMDSDFDRESWNGFKIKYFNDSQDVLPNPKYGDAVMIRGIRIAQFQGSLIGLCSQHDKVPWTIFCQPDGRGGNLNIESSPDSTPSPSEKSYAITLLNREDEVSLSPQSKTTAHETPMNNALTHRSTLSIQGRSQKFSLIKDVTVSTFVDLVVQVIKTYYEDGKFLLYVTDYTRNKSLFDYTRDSDESGHDENEFNYTSRYERRWPGPFGRMTLQVTLWEPHAYFARQNVKEDDFILLRNVHIKIGHNGVRLEGNIHTDRVFPDRIDVVLINDDTDNEHLREVVKRKREYWKSVKEENAKRGNGAESTKRKPKENEKLSRKAKKQQKNKESRDGETEEIPSAQDNNQALNGYIRTQTMAIPYRSISDILHNESHNNTTPDGVEYRLPFQNVRYRSRLRVVDFFPHSLEDFSVPYNKEYDYLSDVETDDEEGELGDDPSGSLKWEWRFCLLVEDGIPNTQHAKDQPKERIELLVSKSDAVFLLKMDALDLKQNPEALSRLREKLFILWGDLEERKRADPEKFNSGSSEVAVSAKPFACCIKEYGVKAKKGDARSSTEERPEKEQDATFGWERRFGMLGTTISD